jgi:hypothetical protein
MHNISYLLFLISRAKRGISYLPREARYLLSRAAQRRYLLFLISRAARTARAARGG